VQKAKRTVPLVSAIVNMQMLVANKPHIDGAVKRVRTFRTRKIDRRSFIKQWPSGINKDDSAEIKRRSGGTRKYTGIFASR
jgi:hypothetical protein